MKLKKPDSTVTEMDMTPMIDMTFQLIAFFMVLINFGQGEQNRRIQLPSSELAKPPESAIEHAITVHLTREGTVIIGGEELQIPGLPPYLAREASVLQEQGLPLTDATIVIRAHKDSQTGYVQQLIQVCQQNRYERFVLRAQETGGDSGTNDGI